MKITELTKIAQEQVFESLKADTDHTFSDETLQEIAQAVASNDGSSTGGSLDEFKAWLKDA
jgi:hypothetical protein